MGRSSPASSKTTECPTWQASPVTVNASRPGRADKAATGWPESGKASDAVEALAKEMFGEFEGAIVVVDLQGRVEQIHLLRTRGRFDPGECRIS